MNTAVLASMQASARYQALIQRASQQGMQRLQDKLAEHAEPGRQIDSLKALYDLWVDSAEEAYAEIAMSDEFREAYGEMVNTQMRVRQMQQQQTEQMCQQLGVPTRTEVSSLGERLQALRREFRASQTQASADHVDEITALHRELAALKRQVANGATVASSAKKATPARPSTPAVKKPLPKAPVKARTTVASKAKPGTASKSRTSPRKRK
jgi:polyhydroxyalkanoate synthase subunit PhaE